MLPDIKKIKVYINKMRFEVAVKLVYLQVFYSPCRVILKQLLSDDSDIIQGIHSSHKIVNYLKKKNAVGTLLRAHADNENIYFFVLLMTCGSGALYFSV